MLGGPKTEVTYKNVFQFDFLSEFAEQRMGKIKTAAAVPGDVGACAIGGTVKDTSMIPLIKGPPAK